jgi:hypothetical protein
MGKPVEKVLVTNVTGANTGTSVATIVNGDILIFNRTWGTALTGTPTITSNTANDVIYISLGLAPEGNMTMLTSDAIPVRNVTGYTLSTYVAPVEEVMTIPFGTNVITSNSEYSFDIQYINSNFRVLQQKPMAERYSYVTTANATQAELAFAMAVRAGNDNNANRYRKVEVTSDGTFTASSGGAATMTQYSKTFTIVESSGGANDAGLYNADGSQMKVGDILKIGGTSATTPLYQITAVSGIGTALATISISERYQATSGSVSAPNLLVQTTAATTYNLVITGLPIQPTSSSPNIPLDLYTKVNFTITLFEVNGPVVPAFTPTITTSLNWGIGYWEEVRDKEFLASGYLGVQNRTMFPGMLLNPPIHAVSGNQYDLLTISYYEKVVDGLNAVDNNSKILTIAFKSDVTTKRAAVVTILNSLFGSVGLPAQ